MMTSDQAIAFLHEAIASFDGNNWEPYPNKLRATAALIESLAAHQEAEAVSEQQIENAVEAILFDMSDRRGLSGQWDSMDDDIQQEVIRAWRDIIRVAVRSCPPARSAAEKGEAKSAPDNVMQTLATIRAEVARLYASLTPTASTSEKPPRRDSAVALLLAWHEVLGSWQWYEKSAGDWWCPVCLCSALSLSIDEAASDPAAVEIWKHETAPAPE